MHPKNVVAIIILCTLLLTGIGYGIYKFAPNLLAVIGDKTPIFCNDYEFTCCNEQIDATIPEVSITDETPWQCPPTSHRCKFTSIYGAVFPFQPYIGSENCYLDKSILGKRWKCSDEKASTRKTLYPGEYVWIMNTVTKRSNVAGRVNDITITIPRLDFCGRAGCTVGVPVSGADQCTFHPKYEKVYTTTGTLKTNQVSYTVLLSQCVLAFQSGDRHICGYMEEQCDKDADCGGHTYGNQECYARKLQTYGCRDFGREVPMEQDRLPGDAGWGTTSSESLFGSRCEVIKTQTVQCCGDTDCGTGFFCDRTTWTCEKEVECTEDSDCGVSTVCDYSTLELKTPKCVWGECAYTKQSVDCCFDSDCALGYYCASDYTCDKRVIPKKTCPFECCTNEEMYFDRTCPEGETCTDEHICTKPVPGKDKFNFDWLLALPILLTIGASVLWGYTQKQKTGSYAVMDFLIGGIVGLIAGLVIRWVFTNWLVLLLVGVLGGGGMIFLVLFVGGLPLLISILNMFKRK